MAYHLWVALSPHGYGHAAMTAPVVAELRRRRPGLALTIQTALPRDFLATRYGSDFTHVTDIPDFGLRMTSATGVDLDATAAEYGRLHADWPAVVERETERLVAAAPDLVLANVPYVTIAAAARAGIPVAGYSSLEWSGIYAHYLGDRPESATIAAQMLEAYNAGDVFLQVTPAMPMPRLAKLKRIGPVARRGDDRRSELRRRFGTGRVGLVAFGGIDHALDWSRWPRLDGWTWLTTLERPDRGDVLGWEAAGMGFADLIASVEVVVTKPGYGTFTEAALAETPVLYIPRPDWPESPHLDRWLEGHTRALAVPLDALFGDRLETQLRTLFSLPGRPLASPSGIDEAVETLESMLDGNRVHCGCS
jgi:hypothetical protein